MGLDMYLHAERYVSSNPMFDEDDPDHFEGLLATFASSEVREATSAVQYAHANVSFQVGYWRKAHDIHSWFVRVCQDGRDECQKTHVDRAQLKDLRLICLRGLASRDGEMLGELLVPEGGYNFGGRAEYDHWYWENIQSTIDQLDRVIAIPDRWSLYYQSSW